MSDELETLREMPQSSGAPAHWKRAARFAIGRIAELEGLLSTIERLSPLWIPAYVASEDAHSHEVVDLDLLYARIRNALRGENDGG